VSTTSAGERFNPVGSGEIDQGQRDGRTETLGLDLPGMLMATAELDTDRRSLPRARPRLPRHRILPTSARPRQARRPRPARPDGDLRRGGRPLGVVSSQPPVSKFQIRTEQRYRLSLASPGAASLFGVLVRRQTSDTSSVGCSRTASAPPAGTSAPCSDSPSDITTTAPLRRANARRSRLAKRTSTSHVAALFAADDELAVQRRSMSGESDDPHPSRSPHRRGRSRR
jgi:hypothetical protein